MDNLFSTHPNTTNRIAALQELARETGQIGGPRADVADPGQDPNAGPWSSGARPSRGASGGPWG
jgi:heat shock protein HtpX